ncbi:hypothetical protein N9J84_01570 [Porticoccaceae bacterium]|nr:hypothetical protein [Porticoccaceae bacterium]
MRCIILLLTFSGYVLASDFPDAPATELLQDQSGARNAIYAQCNKGKSDRELNCQFFQMSVSYETNPDDIEAEVLAETARAEALEASSDEKTLREEMQEICLDLATHKNTVDVSERGGLSLKALELTEKSCNAKTTSEAVRHMLEAVVALKRWEAVTCTVWPNTWSESFKYRTAGGYWISRENLGGQCGVINISTLKKDGYKWSYESKRIITDSAGVDGALVCADIDERTVKYSPEASIHDVNCKEMKFGWHP